MHIKLTAWLAALLLSASMADARAQETPAPAPAEPPAEVRELIDMLRKPAVQDWLAKGAPAGSPVSAAAEGGGQTNGGGGEPAREFPPRGAGTRGRVAAPPP